MIKVTGNNDNNKIYLHKKEDTMLGLGIQELMVILIIVMVLFGASKLPELGKGMGSFIKNLKKGLTEQDEIDVTPKKDTANVKEKVENTAK
ncbi:Twin-arginine translocation protein TatA/E [Candidatus Magnetobacterium bavaricum]|uniref:Sec-independent protein translocase protein TatA n=1 Tax=Candidatus Magnetobacterium bavaricum TaxID=29290 RepID=A0A0F3GHV3_9BACT|nr:Twin-arginine translocation protein TatA/E [Candidatus Magnetobacterium bavaricum]